MRLFFDANVITYIAIFESFLIEGTEESLEDSCNDWMLLQGGAYPQQELLLEVYALRILYIYDEQSHFDWLFSTVAVQEIMRIRDAMKRSRHYDLLDRLVEHRNDVYEDENINTDNKAFEWLLPTYFPQLLPKMRNDALQFCEAVYVEAVYFITNDVEFIKKASLTKQRTQAIRPSEIPFVTSHLVDIM